MQEVLVEPERQKGLDPKKITKLADCPHKARA
jgi:hypothetical protein